MAVRVLQIDRTAGKAGLLALATVDVGGGLIVRGFRITESRNGPRVAVPARTWFDAGERYTEPLLDLPEPLRREVFECVLRAYVEGNKGHETAR